MEEKRIAKKQNFLTGAAILSISTIIVKVIGMFYKIPLKNVIGEDDFKKMDDEAEKRRDSAKNVFFYPYFAGAGFPHNMDGFNSCVLGLELMNDKYDLARA